MNLVSRRRNRVVLSSLGAILAAGVSLLVPGAADAADKPVSVKVELPKASKKEAPKVEVKVSPPKVPEVKVAPPKVEVKAEPRKAEPPKVQVKAEPPKVEAKSAPAKNEVNVTPPRVEAKVEPVKAEVKAGPAKVESKSDAPKADVDRKNEPRPEAPEVAVPEPSKPAQEIPPTSAVEPVKSLPAAVAEAVKPAESLVETVSELPAPIEAAPLAAAEVIAPVVETVPAPEPQAPAIKKQPSETTESVVEVVTSRPMPAPVKNLPRAIAPVAAPIIETAVETVEPTIEVVHESVSEVAETAEPVIDMLEPVVSEPVSEVAESIAPMASTVDLVTAPVIELATTTIEPTVEVIEPIIETTAPVTELATDLVQETIGDQAHIVEPIVAAVVPSIDEVLPLSVLEELTVIAEPPVGIQPALEINAAPSLIPGPIAGSGDTHLASTDDTPVTSPEPLVAGPMNSAQAPAEYGQIRAEATDDFNHSVPVSRRSTDAVTLAAKRRIEPVPGKLLSEHPSSDLIPGHDSSLARRDTLADVNAWERITTAQLTRQVSALFEAHHASVPGQLSAGPAWRAPGPVNVAGRWGASLPAGQSQPSVPDALARVLSAVSTANINGGVSAFQTLPVALPNFASSTLALGWRVLSPLSQLTPLSVVFSIPQPPG